MSRYSKSRKGAGNPAPTEAHEANRKGAGRTRTSVMIDNDLLATIDTERDAQTLAQWESRSDIINYALALVQDEIQAAIERKVK